MTRDPVDLAALAIRNALAGGIPFLRLGAEGKDIVLAYRRRGGTIEDPDCDEDFEALETKVFRRFPASVDGKDTFRWLGWCRLDEEELAATLRRDIEAMDRVEREALGPDAAWQSAQWQDAVARREALESSVGSRP